MCGGCSRTPPAPLFITAAGLTEENEGRLVQVAGAVARFEPRGLLLRDAHGSIPIYFPETLPWRRPYVEIGEQVKKSQTLCIIEAMKLMNEIESEVDGEIMEIFVENGKSVEYGQRLFSVRPVA